MSFPQASSGNLLPKNLCDLCVSVVKKKSNCQAFEKPHEPRFFYWALLHSVITHVITQEDLLMIKVKLTSIGNSMGIVLPKEALKKLKIGKGETLYLVDSPEGFMLTPYQQNFEKQMEVAEKVMNKYRNALHELAK